MGSEYWLKARGEKILPDERQYIYRLARGIASHFDNPVIVNIGVSWGASVHCLYAGAPNARLIAIDIDFLKRPLQGKELLKGVDLVVTDSYKYGIQFKEEVHLLFVDGEHDEVERDIEAWILHMPVLGIVMFHDYSPQPRDRERLAKVKRDVDGWYSSVDNWRKLDVVDSVAAFRRVK